MLNVIKDWWTGKEYFVDGRLPGIRYKHHWTAKIAHIIVSFYLEHWKWIWSTIIAISALSISYLKLS